MSTHPWSDIAAQLEGTLRLVNSALLADPQFLAFTTSDHIVSHIIFGIKSGDSSENGILVNLGPGSSRVSTGPLNAAAFTLCARPEQWEAFFQPIPKAPYQSYWGMFGQNIHQEGVEVLGNKDGYIQYTHIWRRVLEIIHESYCGPIKTDVQELTDEDYITGRYIYVSPPEWGRTKLFYEQSGRGTQDIVFLHTAGSDSRQYHGVMNDPRMLEKCNMVAFDLPGHGRSFPAENQLPGKHTNTEDSYVGCIAEVIKKLKLNKPIVCGASMAGHVCLAVATRAEEVGVGGTIPCQGCEYLDMHRTPYDKSPFINQSLFNPEWTYGMMAPTAPLINKQLVWHTYSSQAYGIFHGDLDFYFGGWDGRMRVDKIDTKKCPVYMLTGEYDWSNTPAMSKATADRIPGAKFQAMADLGHFPATENPRIFVGYLLEAIAHIQETRIKNT